MRDEGTGMENGTSSGGRAYRVSPAGVHSNDWQSLEVADLDSLSPAHFVTVVIPFYERPDALELTLAGLERQTYPRHLFEVVVVDDGSDPPLVKPETPLDLRIEYQEDLGFGLARARNTGARAADGDIVLFLDCDMIPEENWLAAHARWHHAASDAVTMGFRFHVEVDGLRAADVSERRGSLSELFDGREVTRPEWIEVHLARTCELTSGDDDIFRVITGGNFGISRSFFEVVGGFDETFTQWGAEDREFAYRAYARGSLLVPERDALCWHQGAGATLSDDERRSLGLQFAKMSQLVPHRVYRREGSGRSFTVPKFVVTLRPADAPAEAILANVEELLASKTSDLVVWVEQRRTDDSFDWLRRLTEPDPRVFFGPPGGAIERFPVAAFHITMDCGASYDPWMVGRLRGALGSAAYGTALFEEGAPVTIARTWALHRSCRAAVEISKVGDTVEFAMSNHVPEEFDRLEEVVLAALGDLESRVESRIAESDRTNESRFNQVHGRFNQVQGRFNQVKGRFVRLENRMNRRFNKVNRRFNNVERLIKDRLGYRIMQRSRRIWGILRKVLSEAAAVRSPSDARRFASWFYDSARRRVSTPEPPPTAARTPRPAASPTHRRRASYALGADIVTIGSRAEAVFTASKRVRNSVVGDTGNPRFPFLGGRHVDLLVVDSSLLLTDGVREDVPSSARVVELSEAPPVLSVPAFDPEQVNPIGWGPHHVPEVVSLGPASDLPEGVRVDRSAGSRDPETLRYFRHVEDIAGYHESIAVRAATLAEFAASGVLVHIADQDPGLERLLGKELHLLMTADMSQADDSHTREGISIAMRRAALRTHSLRSRARQILSEGGVDGPRLPQVSVLVPTRRPDRLPATVKMIGRQSYPRLELVLGLHGEGFDLRSLETAVEGLDRPVVTVRVPANQPLGGVLKAAAEASSGTLLAKMDDDDAYGDEHIWDLVLAHEFSRAELVAKASEYVYLSGSDKTVRLKGRQGERYVEKRSVSGGVLMISRHDLDYAGGWRRLPRQVDLALADDVLQAGGRIYWTHGSGYARIRHGGKHTWKMDDSFFLQRAADARDGFDPEFAGVHDPTAATRSTGPPVEEDPGVADRPLP
ncbi:MAG: glycosyltransferase [bacterium]|nr:glycosyltransferase [bacterium]MDE0290309.1 glycosyltransferase [bacterium]MDE0440347.1 glycosyltransferase [bacterium]